MTDDLDTQDYVVLRYTSVAGVPDEQLRFGTAAVGSAAELETVVANLSPAEASDLRRANDTVDAAPLLPLRLVEPVATSTPSARAATACAWGVEAVGALTSPLTGAGVKVAVLDTGIDAGHPAFSHLTVTQEDFTGEGDGDRDGHGTHCAGTIAGGEVDGVRIGVAPGIDELFVAKVIGSAGTGSQALVDAMLWALGKGAHVVSMSLRTDFPGLVESWVGRGTARQAATSRALSAYRDNLRLFGQLAGLFRATTPSGPAALVVAATGNESQRDAPRPYRIDVAPPAAADGVVAVGALGRAEDGALGVAPFSNTGATVAGPGVDILSAKPGGGGIVMSGTSMATPHVVGVAALWVERLMAGDQRVDIPRLFSRVTGNVTELPGLDPLDVGSGLVRAPEPARP